MSTSNLQYRKGYNIPDMSLVAQFFLAFGLRSPNAGNGLIQGNQPISKETVEPQPFLVREWVGAVK